MHTMSLEPMVLPSPTLLRGRNAILDRAHWLPVTLLLVDGIIASRPYIGFWLGLFFSLDPEI